MARIAGPSYCGRGHLEMSSVPSGLTRVSPEQRLAMRRREIALGPHELTKVGGNRIAPGRGAQPAPVQIAAATG